MLEDPRHRESVAFRRKHRDGSWRWLEADGRNLLADPDVEGLVVYLRPAPERRADEEGEEEQVEVAPAEQRFNAMFENPLTLTGLLDASLPGACAGPPSATPAARAVRALVLDRGGRRGTRSADADASPGLDRGKPHSGGMIAVGSTVGSSDVGGIVRPTKPWPSSKSLIPVPHCQRTRWHPMSMPGCGP